MSPFLNVCSVIYIIVVASTIVSLYFGLSVPILYKILGRILVAIIFVIWIDACTFIDVIDQFLIA